MGRIANTFSRGVTTTFDLGDDVKPKYTLEVIASKMLPVPRGYDIMIPILHHLVIYETMEPIIKDATTVRKVLTTLCQSLEKWRVWDWSVVYAAVQEATPPQLDIMGIKIRSRATDMYDYAYAIGAVMHQALEENEERYRGDDKLFDKGPNLETRQKEIISDFQNYLLSGANTVGRAPLRKHLQNLYELEKAKLVQTFIVKRTEFKVAIEKLELSSILRESTREVDVFYPELVTFHDCLLEMPPVEKCAQRYSATDIELDGPDHLDFRIAKPEL